MAIVTFLLVAAQLFQSCKKVKKENTVLNNTNGGDTLGRSIQLWGVTTTGGINDSGMLFKINGDGSGFDSFYSFNLASGCAPWGTLCKAGNGKLYGTTTGGGANGSGTVFSFDPMSNAFKKILDFDVLVNWINPMDCHLVLASNGKIYGAGFQFIFCIDPSNDAFTVLYKNIVMSETFGNVILGDNNNLYGTVSGGNNSVSDYIGVFSFDLASNTIDYLCQVGVSQGFEPVGNMRKATDGNLYGVTMRGGVNDDGVLFKFSPADNTYTKLLDFSPSIGSAPAIGTNIEEYNGKLFGVTYAGGKSSGGVLYSYTLLGGSFAQERSFGKSGDDFVSPRSLLLTKRKLMFLSGGGIDGDALIRYNPSDNTFKTIYTFPNRQPKYTLMSGSLIEY